MIFTHTYESVRNFIKIIVEQADVCDLSNFFCTCFLPYSLQSLIAYHGGADLARCYDVRYYTFI